MDKQELIDALQTIIDCNMDKVLINIHAGYLIHAVKYLKEQEPARKLTWDDVIALPPDQDVWIQEGWYGLHWDRAVSYDKERGVMSFTTREYSDISYGSAWIAWGRMPTQEQFETAFD